MNKLYVVVCDGSVTRTTTDETIALEEYKRSLRVKHAYKQVSLCEYNLNMIHRTTDTSEAKDYDCHLDNLLVPRK